MYNPAGIPSLSQRNSLAFQPPDCFSFVCVSVSFCLSKLNLFASFAIASCCSNGFCIMIAQTFHRLILDVVVHDHNLLLLLLLLLWLWLWLLLLLLSSFHQRFCYSDLNDNSDSDNNFFSSDLANKLQHQPMDFLLFCWAIHGDSIFPKNNTKHIEFVEIKALFVLWKK